MYNIYKINIYFLNFILKCYIDNKYLLNFQFINSIDLKILS